ncbi:hypothetical protein MMC13_000978 [Lambiella insularis]|nr:hypothetical protein [Lambiella insularis]
MDVAPSTYQLRIPPTAFIGSLTTFLVLAVLSALARTTLRLRQNHTLYTDDYFLLYAVVALCVCAGVAFSIKDLIYLQIYVGLGWEKPAPDFFQQMLEFEKRIQVASALTWSALYAVKLSFLFFFRNLIRRVRALEVWWWVVLACVIVGGAASIPLSFIICSNFSEAYMQFCPIEYQLSHEKIYLDTTTALDIFTDLLVLSIPIALLWKVKISLRRKLALGSMLCLSAFMIIIAIIRTASAPLPVNQVIDTSFLIFFSGLEAATAIIMVSLTAFRSIFGQEVNRSKESKKRWRSYELVESAEEGKGVYAAHYRPRLPVAALRRDVVSLMPGETAEAWAPRQEGVYKYDDTT